MEAGEIGLRPLFLTLKDLDRPDVVLQMARQEEHPSYMRFIRRGETTLSEFWQDACRSKCHDMFGTIYEWFYAAVLGIEVVEDAYDSFTVSPPYRSEFSAVSGSVACPNGVIDVSYSRQETGAISVRLSVPFGSKCALRLPKGCTSLQVLRADKHMQCTAEHGELRLTQGAYEITCETST